MKLFVFFPFLFFSSLLLLGIIAGMFEWRCEVLG